MKVQMSISGEFITDIARTWFWEEDRPYEKSEDLLLASMCGTDQTQDELKAIARQIIEGEYKLEGINELTLEEDGAHIRRITDKCDELVYKEQIQNIQNHMELYPTNYIDPYSTCKSIYSFNLYHGEPTMKETFAYFSEFKNPATGKFMNYYPAYETFFKAGLWLFDLPEVIHCYNDGKPLPPGDNPEFWQALRDEYVPKLETERRFDWINRYDAMLRREAQKQEYLENVITEATENGKARREATREYDHIDMDTLNNDEFIDYAHGTYLVDPSDVSLRPEDDLNQFTGMISPYGDFYQCGFGCHEALAKALAMLYPKKVGFDSRSEAMNTDSDRVLDRFWDAGWVIIHSLSSTYLTCQIPKVTNDQIKKLYDICIRFDLHYIKGFDELIKYHSN